MAWFRSPSPRLSADKTWVDAGYHVHYLVALAFTQYSEVTCGLGSFPNGSGGGGGGGGLLGGCELLNYWSMHWKCGGALLRPTLYTLKHGHEPTGVRLWTY